MVQWSRRENYCRLRLRKDLPGHAHVFIEVLRGFVDPEERDLIFLLMKSLVQNEGRALPLLQRRIRVQTVGIRSVRLRLLQD